MNHPKVYIVKLPSGKYYKGRAKAADKDYILTESKDRAATMTMADACHLAYHESGVVMHK